MYKYSLHLLVLGAVVAAFPPSGVSNDDDLLDQIERAHKATKERLGSYTASATFTRKEKDWKEPESTKVKLQYKAGNYRLEIFPPRVERPEDPPYDKIIVVADAESFYSTFYTKRFPAGCETNVYKRDSASVPAATGMNWDVANLDGVADQFPEIRKLYGMRAAQDANGDIRTEHDLDNVTRVECTASAAAGLNISRIAFVSPSTGAIQGITTLDWAQKAGKWYVKEARLSYPKQDSHFSVRFETFEVDVPLEDKLFTFDGLDPCPGSRVIDRRPKAERK